VQEGPLACGYGCLGFGDCVKACDYNAIYIHNGVADIIASRCTACGKCVDACPKKLIELFPAHTQYTVCCVNKDRGATTRRNCAVGCVACMRCTKVCRIRAVTVQNNVAVIDPIKCRQCGECVKICPQYSIKHFDCILRRSDSA
jgi:heterodisulfide reductase subunit A-like polyferredoxin